MKSNITKMHGQQHIKMHGQQHIKMQGQQHIKMHGQKHIKMHGQQHIKMHGQQHIKMHGQQHIKINFDNEFLVFYFEVVPFKFQNLPYSLCYSSFTLSAVKLSRLAHDHFSGFSLHLSLF